MPLCWHVHQRRSVFIRSPPGLHYLELLMQWAMWTWNWKQMWNSVAKSLWLPWPYRHLPMGLSMCLCVCLCACVRVCVCGSIWSRKPFPGWHSGSELIMFHINQRILELFLHCFHQMLSCVLCCAACLGCNPWHETWLTLDWLDNFAYVSYYPNAAPLWWK